MVRPATKQLSALKLPWQKPTRSHSAARVARRSRARSANASATGRSASTDSGATRVASPSPCNKSGYSRAMACWTRSANSRVSASPPRAARRAKRSTCPTRANDGATRHVMAQGSSIMMSGSDPPPRCAMSWRMSWRRICNGNCARRGSSSEMSSSGGASASSRREYHGRRDVSAADTTRLSARVVGTPRKCMASDARNSRKLERSTARPSAPRQNGVLPPPLSWSS
mmetsp:Transcript_10772/g.33235  ORF Transcript_10772/g.33235 Transcript_10772/m.33235 type:complete len:227 (+) Transcript_10772:918-1598(+)